jgi:hypothetical protein
MPVVRLPFVGVLVLAASLAAPALAQSMFAGRGGPPMFKPGPGPDELWETTMKMEMAGMTMGGDTQQVCIKKGRGDADRVPKSEECTTTDVRTSGNRTTFAMVCKGDPPMSGTGDITSTPNANSGRITMRSTRRGEEMTMVQTFSSKRIGTCTDTSEQYVAKIEADSKAMVAKTCAEGMDTLEPSLFEGNSACAAQKKQFCDKAAGVLGEMRTPAGFTAARRKFPNTLQRAFQACNLNYAAVRMTACQAAAAQRDWNFVGSGNCDEEVTTYGPRHCNVGSNRSPDAQYAALCARYAAITRGTRTGGDVAPPAAPPQAEAAKPAAPDPVKSGVDAVRKLLPF